ncbi:MAG: hypothetical protein ACD_20C00431G0002 [uncultured bacterium]|nr:MAG: hypothetical protein ACD_20C00431G0002 [uncultured bacterium]
MTENDSNTMIDVIEDANFSYDGYEVVRGEYFAHLYEPSITFNRCKVYLNTACLKRLPDINYVQILVNSEEKKLAVRPCSEDEKDSFQWCTLKRKPKQISCRVFFAKIVHLMDWNPDYRYKLLGKLIKSGNEYLFIFDLTATEIYQRTIQEDEKPKTSRTPVFPAEWQNQFGLPVEEHHKQLQVNLFNGYTVFGIKDKIRTNQEDTITEEIKDE